MPKNWPDNVPPSRPRKTKKPKGSSGKGSGTTVGMAILIFGTAALVITSTFGYVLYIRFVG
jgi:hypothetical protein